MVRKFITACSLAFIATSSLFAQNENLFSRTIFSKEISFIRTDTTHGSQSTVIEYPKFLVIIELPIINEGSERSTNLEQDIPKAEQFLNYLKKEYNNKPIKYVLSSHWHLHSLSGITPFFNQGAKLIAAKTNWEYSVKNGLFNKMDTKDLAKQVIPITKDTTILDKTAFPISVLFIDETYTHKPTKDYLFFYMPKIKSIHASCMCAMNVINFKQTSEFIYSDRVIDLEKAIQSRNLNVENLFKLTEEFDKDKKTYLPPVFNKSYFEEFKQKGTSMEAIVKNYASYDLSTLQLQKDSILNHLMTNRISAQIINATVYECIKQKAYTKAINWAQILNVYYIGFADYIDTMGEAYYNAGELAIAQRISNQLTQLNPKLTNQFKTWEQNKLNEH